MAVITPQSDVYLLKAPLELSDSNQLTFANATAQFNYFNSLPKIAADNFTYQRKDHVIRFPREMDEIINYNYVMYRNDAYSNKWFYAFITDMSYMNDRMTAITIKTDVFQTWQFDLNYRRTFVEREHVNDDTPGAHTVPEGLELGEYQILDLRNSPIDENWCVAFATTGLPNGLSEIQDENRTIGGVFTGLHLFATRTYAAAKKVIDIYNADSGLTADAIINVYLVPRNTVDINTTTGNIASTGNTPTTIYTPNVEGASAAVYPLKDSTTQGPFQLQQPAILAGEYRPVNNKLFTYPYTYFYVSNKVGEDVVFKWEDFPFETMAGYTARTCTYKKAIVPSTSVSAKLYFTSYKDYTEGEGYGSRLYNYGVNYGKVPVCAWTTDYFTNWLTQNGVNIGIGVASSAIGLALAPVTGGASAVVGAGIAAATSVASTMGEVHKASTTPDQAHGDVNTGDMMFAYTRNSISFYFMSIRPEIARQVDGFFSMYGYKVNRVKVPNITGRRNWNFVKTIDCYIGGDVPQSDMSEIKEMFNKGITFWHNPATFMDYSQNNGII